MSDVANDFCRNDSPTIQATLEWSAHVYGSSIKNHQKKKTVRRGAMDLIQAKNVNVYASICPANIASLNYSRLACARDILKSCIFLDSYVKYKVSIHKLSAGKLSLESADQRNLLNKIKHVKERWFFKLAPLKPCNISDAALERLSKDVEKILGIDHQALMSYVKLVESKAMLTQVENEKRSVCEVAGLMRQ